MDDKVCGKPDVDLDADELMLQQYIKLGMPKQSSDNMVSCHASKRVECNPINVKINVPQVIIFLYLTNVLYYLVKILILVY